MREPAVADSTCLIAFEQVGYLDLVPALFEPIRIPPAVAQEFGSVPKWATVVKPNDTALVTALKMMVDDGEAEAIALASELGSRAILDDLQAREVARRMEIRIIGTVGILVRAKRESLLPEVAPVLRKLSESGFHLSEPLKREVLMLAGE
jgi:predicted nucleic acid-binding protein